MHTPPITSYSGLTIIIDEPSRFDKDQKHLCAGPVRKWLDEILSPRYSLASADLWDLTQPIVFHPATTKVLLLGDKAAEHFQVFNDPPGYPLIVKRFPARAAFYPQDCCVHRSFRDNEEDEEETSEANLKEVTPTLFKNRRFWTAYHIRKFLYPVKQKIYRPLEPHFYPNIETILKTFSSISKENLYLDIETSRLHRCLTCIGVSSDSLFPKVFCIPVYLNSSELAYKDFYRIHKVLSLALLRNNVVIHNASFDLAVLHGWYKFPFPANVYDTMIANHRIFLEVEKSLAHTISAWTDLAYHKNFSTEVYSNDQQSGLWLYNTKDVYALKLIKEAQENYATNDIGLQASIKQANESIIPYLTTSLEGLKLDLLSLAAAQQKLFIHKKLFARIAAILSNVQDFNPGSSKQCADFFHKKLNYAIISRTKTNAPAMGAKQLYQLLVKYDNPLLPVILKYREAHKDASMLESELLILP